MGRIFLNIRVNKINPVRKLHSSNGVGQRGIISNGVKIMFNNKLFNGVKYGIYLAFILPLVFTSRTMFPAHFGKTVLFQILIEILLALALIYFSLKKEAKIVKLNLFDWLIVIFIFTEVLASFFGVNFTRSFWGDQSRAQGVFIWLHFLIFYLLLRQFFKTKKDWNIAIVLILIVSFISSMVALFGSHAPVIRDILATNGRISGVMGNPIFFASYLILPVFLSLAFVFLIKKDLKWQIVILACFLVNLITLLLSGVRGAFVGLVGGIFISWLFFIIFSKNRKFKNILFIAGLLLTVFLFAGYIFNQNSPYLQKNLPAASRLLNISFKDTTAETRIMAWEIALKAWREKPLFGWGPENYQDAFDKYYNPKFLKYTFAETTWDKPHNYPLEVLSTSGLVGFLAYLAIFIYLFYFLIKNIKKSENEAEKNFLFILAGGFTAYVLQSSFAMESTNSLQLWFFCLALLLGYQQSDREGLNFYSGKKIINFIGWLAIICILILPFFIYKNYQFFRSSVLMGDSRDLAEANFIYLWKEKAPKVLDIKVPFIWEQAIFMVEDITKLDKVGELNKDTLSVVSQPLIAIFSEEVKKNPQSYLFRFWLSQVYSFMGEYVDGKYFDNSNLLLEEALKISAGRQHTSFLLAKNYMLQGKNQEAVDILEKLLSGDVNNSLRESHWFLGIALIRDGQKDRGIKELENGGNFALGFKNNVLYLIDLYAERKDYKKIIPLYERLIAQEPKNSQYYANLAATYAAAGDKTNALESLNKAVELDPTLTEEARNFIKQNELDK